MTEWVYRWTDVDFNHIQYSASIIPNRTKLITRTLSISCQDKCQFRSLTLRRPKLQHIETNNMEQVTRYVIIFAIYLKTMQHLCVIFTLKFHWNAFILCYWVSETQPNNSRSTKCCFQSIYSLLLLHIFNNHFPSIFGDIMNKITFSPKFEDHF